MGATLQSLGLLLRPIRRNTASGVHQQDDWRSVILSLNPDQEVAANSIEGDFVVVAGPGAGKTAVFVQRFMRMRTVYNIPSKDILNLTFTRSAATEMVERVGLDDVKQ